MLRWLLPTGKSFFVLFLILFNKINENFGENENGIIFTPEKMTSVTCFPTAMNHTPKRKHGTEPLPLSGKPFKNDEKVEEQ